jgi:TRAP-type C4-dicarboxylate transport system substrate-binding protein
MLAAVGAVPVTVLPGEFYESLQRGSVDCMVLPWDLMVAFKLHEVAKHGSAIDLGALVSNPQWYSLKKWESLPANVRTLLTDVAKEALALDLAKAKESEQNALAAMKAAGVEILPFPDQARFESMLPDFIGEWVQAMQKIGKGAEAEAMARRWDLPPRRAGISWTGPSSPSPARQRCWYCWSPASRSGYRWGSRASRG